MEYCCTSRTYVVWLVCDLVESTVHPVLFGPMLDWTYLWKSTVRPVYFCLVGMSLIFSKYRYVLPQQLCSICELESSSKLLFQQSVEDVQQVCLCTPLHVCTFLCVKCACVPCRLCWH